ncbi:MAG: beta-propeller domain-containing protein [Marmoricola sp.]
MRTRTRLALGAGALAGALGLTGAIPGPLPGTGPGLPPASAAALVPFQDCDTLLKWYVDRTLDQVGPWGWGGRYPIIMDQMTARGEAATPQSPAFNGPTGTNLQEAGVDEPDVAKTDGRIVVGLQAGGRVVLTDVTGESPRQLGTWRLPRNEYAEGLLLVGDHVVLTASKPTTMAFDQRIMPGSYPGRQEGTHLLDLDISDPAHPVLTAEQEWSGRALSMRQYGETVRLVTSTGLPDLPFIQPRSSRRSDRETTQRNRDIVRASTIEDWLPTVTVAGRSRPAVPCEEVLHPSDGSALGSETLAVSTFAPGALGSVDAVAVTAAGGSVYASQDRLYVFSTDWGRSLVPMPLDTMTMEGARPEPQPNRTTTTLHAFALDADTTRYVASGSIPGVVRDTWSLDEHQGRLRVAVSWPGKDGTTKESGVLVLDEDGGRLLPVGELRGLGPDEEIQSVRWFDDLAVLVTFREMDPLYTVDLSDPSRPRQLGALKIPGFSSYLHPVGGDRLLGLGTDATKQGRSRGAQAAVYDISDPADARQVDKVRFGFETGLGAAADPHDFTWLPEANAAITSLSRSSDEPGPRMVVLRVASDGTLSTQELEGPGGWSVRALPLGGDRVALVGDSVRIIAVDASRA